MKTLPEQINHIFRCKVNNSYFGTFTACRVTRESERGYLVSGFDKQWKDEYRSHWIPKRAIEICWGEELVRCPGCKGLKRPARSVGTDRCDECFVVEMSKLKSKLPAMSEEQVLVVGYDKMFSVVDSLKDIL